MQVAQLYNKKDYILGYRDCKAFPVVTAERHVWNFLKNCTDELLCFQQYPSCHFGSLHRSLHETRRDHLKPYSILFFLHTGLTLDACKNVLLNST